MDYLQPCDVYELSKCLTLKYKFFVVARSTTAAQTYKVKTVHSTTCL